MCAFLQKIHLDKDYLFLNDCGEIMDLSFNLWDKVFKNKINTHNNYF